ncbi:monovalent cation/H+ antiporter subunit D [Oxalicibacterium faecigallinarum]|uniref:Monovalent cation/H+ antiporter subunit D n=1 Tax=Oxalicibacterium faecigallinarum TaxID=573741 RepID=A0A8J3AYK5_9BURK|nr:monovalent cation/H+ antiporter subunit D [Oxalicibacterium faecigallinarum]GGI19746.1 monovalent cation/H+ antiporter subunit D [Oxalicibacterium faecigallinarum]
MSSLSWNQHLIALPILVPLICGALLIMINESRHQLKFFINLVSVMVQFAIAVSLMKLTDTGIWEGNIGIYLAANWSAPFGIALAADRLSALMLLLTSIMGGAALLYSAMRWSRIGVHFHSLFQFLLMGINGAFLTHDLFNLFVFFEVMLAASYGLVLHGYNTTRIRAGMQYIAINLAASLLFLIGVALIYASTGTLNMSDLAGRLAGVQGEDLFLLKIGVAILAIAFLTKSAMWPLGFWLPTTYSAASPPVAAMLVLMTKVGAYVVLRLWLLVFSNEAGEAAGFGYQALLWGGMATILFGAAGMLSSEGLGRMAGYGAIVSSGTLLAVVGYGQASVVTAGLYYLLGSTLAMAAFVLLIELIERIRKPGASILALTMEAFAVDETPEETAGVGIPGALAFLGLAFAACALIIAGMPPLSGFIAKFTIFHALLNPDTPAISITMTTWILIALIVFSGLTAIIALMRFGVRTFWASGAITAPKLHVTEVASITLLLALCIALTLKAGPMFDYLERTGQDLHRPAHYIEKIRSAPVVPGVVQPGEMP